jgi:hypothetical protein
MYLRALAIAATVHPRPSMALGLQVVLAHHRHPAIAIGDVNLGFVLTVAKVGQRSPGG